jgi:hypothetical protein
MRNKVDAHTNQTNLLQHLAMPSKWKKLVRICGDFLTFSICLARRAFFVRKVTSGEFHEIA